MPVNSQNSNTRVVYPGQNNAPNPMVNNRSLPNVLSNQSSRQNNVIQNIPPNQQNSAQNPPLQNPQRQNLNVNQNRFQANNNQVLPQNKNISFDQKFVNQSGPQNTNVNIQQTNQNRQNIQSQQSIPRPNIIQQGNLDPINPKSNNSQIQTSRSEFENINQALNVDLNLDEIAKLNEARKLIEDEETRTDSSKLQLKSESSDTYKVLNLCLYVVPLVAYVVLISRSIKDEDVMWHAKQSGIAQLFWYGILIGLSVLNLPRLGFIEFVPFWNLIAYSALVVAGWNAYNGIRWPIPLVFEIFGWIYNREE